MNVMIQKKPEADDLIISSKFTTAGMPFIIDALDSFSVNPSGISASGFPTFVDGRVLYLENSRLERIIFLLFHCLILRIEISNGLAS